MFQFQNYEKTKKLELQSTVSSPYLFYTAGSIHLEEEEYRSPVWTCYTKTTKWTVACWTLLLLMEKRMWFEFQSILSLIISVSSQGQ